MAFKFGGWFWKRFRATVVNDVWPEVFFFTLIATMVTLVSHLRVNLGISNTILGVLGTVLGLVLGFRTSSAYERYQEGRNLWTNIILASRNLATVIWVHVKVDRTMGGVSQLDAAPGVNPGLEAIIEKKTMINLILAFSVSVKHLLRGESGIFYHDLYPLVSVLPRYSTSHSDTPNPAQLPLWEAHGGTIKRQHSPDSEKSTLPPSPVARTTRVSTYDPEKALPQLVSEFELLPAHNPPKETIYHQIPFLIVFKPIVSLLSWVFLRRAHSADESLTFSGKRRRPPVIDSNIPLEIRLFLSTYFGFLIEQNLLPGVLQGEFLSNLNMLSSSVAHLERVRHTPIPVAYQFHLRICLYLYLFFLPFLLYTSYTWLTIPVTTFSSFLYLGFLEIGQQIEDPFGYDPNDIKIDEIVHGIQRELHEITAHPCPRPSSFIYTTHNKPFAPSDDRTAEKILQDVAHEYHHPAHGPGSLHHVMLQNWRDVNRYTRKH